MNLTMTMIEALLEAHWLFFSTFLLLVIQASASAIVAATPTPAPGTRLARVYRVLEAGALIIGYAKDRGLITPTAAQVLAATDLVTLGRDVEHVVRVRTVPSPEAVAKLGDQTHTAVADTIRALVAEGVLTARPAPLAAPASAAPASATAAAAPPA